MPIKRSQKPKIDKKLFKLNLFFTPICLFAVFANRYMGTASLTYKIEEAAAYILVVAYGVYFFPVFALIVGKYKKQYGEGSYAYNNAPAGAFGIFILMYLLFIIKFSSTITFTIFSWTAESYKAPVSMELSYPKIETWQEFNIVVSPFFSVELEGLGKVAICEELYKRFRKERMDHIQISRINLGETNYVYVPCYQ